MDLTCTENLEKVCSAENDTVIFGDHRVLHKLLRDEILSVPHSDYFETVQNDIQPFMRKVVTTWMLEVRISYFFIYLKHFEILAVESVRN